MDDLFATPPPDPGLEFVQVAGRTYRLRERAGRVVVSWAGPGLTQGVIGGTYANDGDALAAIEAVEARRCPP